MKVYNNDDKRFFSVNEEGLLINELLERAFSEGFEYAQREFAEEKSDNIDKVAAAGLIGGLGAAGAGYLKHSKTKDSAKKELKEMADAAAEMGGDWWDSRKVRNKFEKKVSGIKRGKLDEIRDRWREREDLIHWGPETKSAENLARRGKVSETSILGVKVPKNVLGLRKDPKSGKYVKDTKKIFGKDVKVLSMNPKKRLDKYGEYLDDVAIAQDRQAEKIARVMGKKRNRTLTEAYGNYQNRQSERLAKLGWEGENSIQKAKSVAGKATGLGEKVEQVIKGKKLQKAGLAVAGVSAAALAANQALKARKENSRHDED